MVPEQDFTLALATAKGHSTPIATQALKCQGCGASFVLLPQTISTACPYCASPYVVERTESRTLIPPEGIIPFAVTQDQAQHAVLDWYRSQGFTVRAVNALPAGVYLPVWTFDVGGEITWNCLVEQNDVWAARNGSKLVYENDLPVVASHTLSVTLTEELNAFPRDRLVPYDARYLADWPAETYQIAVSDASLVARSRILAKMRPQIEAGITESFRGLQLSATRMVIETFKLVLVSMWIARFRYEKIWYNVVVNGQTAAVRGEKPRQGVTGWLSGLLGDQ
jgi:DNA-directed RNA polymerase subunit RPC12/RpoP